MVNAAMEIRHGFVVEHSVTQFSALAAEQRDDVGNRALHVGRHWRFRSRGKAPENPASHGALSALGELHADDAALAPHDAAATDRRCEKRKARTAHHAVHIVRPISAVHPIAAGLPGPPDRPSWRCEAAWEWAGRGHR